MTYTDPTETNEPKKPPKICPYCGGPVVTRWFGAAARFQSQARAMPAHVCLKCKIAVRIFKFPKEPLRETRRAARADSRKAVEKADKELRDFRKWPPFASSRF